MKWFDYLLPKLKQEEKEAETDPGLLIGGTGTEIYGGYTDEEYLGELRDPRERYKIYHEMRTSSGVHKMCIKSVRDPLRGAKWGLRAKQGEEDNPRAIEQIEFLNRAIPEREMNKIIEDMTTAVTFGFYLGEIYYKTFETPAGKLMLRPCVKYLSQKTIERWLIDRVEGLQGVNQQAYGDVASDKGSVFIPASKLVHMAVEQEGDNYEGISLLRSSYGSYIRKKVNYEKVAIGNHYLAIPFLKVYQAIAGGVINKKDLKKLKSRLEQRSKGGKALSHIVFPKGWTAEEQGSNFDPLKLYQCNNEEDQEIVRSFCANFLLLTKSSGSHALSSDLSDFFLKGLEEIAKLIDSSFTRDIIERTIKINFNEVSLVELYHSEIGGKGGLKLSQALSSLINSKALTMDDPTEEWIREKYGLPKHDPETKRIPPPGASMPFAFGGGDGGNNGEEGDDNDPPEGPGENGPENDSPDDEGKGKSSQLTAKSLIFAKASEIKAQAKKSKNRIVALRKDISGELKEKTAQIIDKQAKKIADFVKKNRGTNKVLKLKIEDFKVPSTKVVKGITDLTITAYEAEALELSSALGKKKLKQLAVMKEMFRHLCSSDVNDVVSKIDNVMLYQVLESIDALDDPKILQSQLVRSATTIVDGSIGQGKASVLPAKAINTARKVTFEEIYDEIESYTFFNPDPQADICIYLAGKTISSADPDFQNYSPPLHYNCSTVLIPNLKEFKNNPKETRLAPNQTQIESINIGVKAI